MGGIGSLENLENLAFDIDGEIVDAGSGRARHRDQLAQNGNGDPDLAAGGVDTDWEMAELYGEELAGGSNLTPDQNVVEELGEALGVTYEDDEELWCGTKESDRDRHRWELDPASADDWTDRKRR
jgi:hypothetical protein